MAKERITLMLPAGLWDQVKRYAARRRCSASAIAAEGLQHVLQQDDRAARLAALERLDQYHVAVGSPEQLEEEIQRGRMANLT